MEISRTFGLMARCIGINEMQIIGAEPGNLRRDRLQPAKELVETEIRKGRRPR